MAGAPTTGADRRAAFDGALDVDVVFSPFFNALPIRRTGRVSADQRIGDAAGGLREGAGPGCRGRRRSATRGGADGIKLHSPVAETTVTVDADGFILDYPGLAERI